MADHRVGVIALVAAAACGGASVAPAPAPVARPVATDGRIVARLGDREIVDGFGYQQRLVSRADMEAFLARLPSGAPRPTLRIPPDLAAPRFMFGRHGLALVDGNDADGYTVVVDTDFGGSFVDKPRYAMSNATGVWEVVIPGQRMTRMRLDGDRMTIDPASIRRGFVTVVGTEIAVGIVDDGDRVRAAVDLDGDGQLDLRDDGDLLMPGDEEVTIHGHAYARSRTPTPRSRASTSRSRRRR